MEDDRLKDIFKEYDPDVSSRMAFMERLEHNLNAVEIIHAENARDIRHNKIAVFIASLAGFAAGVMFSFILPYIGKGVERLISSIPAEFYLNYIDCIADCNQVITWITIGAVSVFASVGTYNMILNFRPSRDVMRAD